MSGWNRASDRSHDSLVPAKVVNLDPTHMQISIQPDDMKVVGAVRGVTITTDEILGEGAFGIVLAGSMTETWKTANNAMQNKITPVAVKCSRTKMRGKDLARLREEVSIMSLLAHANIVRFHFACVCRDYVYIIMEQCAKGNLYDVMKAYGNPLAMPDILYIGFQMVESLCYVHSKGCIHRDLKPGNFVFDHQGNVKLTDFGLSSSGNSGIVHDNRKVNIIDDAKADAKENANRRMVAGTYSYMAPEIMKQVLHHQQHKHLQKGFRYSVEVDVYSLGVVLFYLATRTSPYWNSMREGTRKNASSKKSSTQLLCEAVSEGRWQWPLPSKMNMPNFDFDFMRLVESMMSVEGSRRPELRSIRQHFIWERRPSALSPNLLSVIRGSAASVERPIKLHSESITGKVENNLNTLERQEAAIRKRFESLRLRYANLARLQAQELARRSEIGSAYHTCFTRIEKEQREHRVKTIWNSSISLAHHGTDQLTENETVRNYSFRPSTLAAYSGAHSPVKAVRNISRSKERKTKLSAKRNTSTTSRRTPSFWLDGPSEKFASSACPTVDAVRDRIKCPKKHGMKILRSFPKLNETAGGTSDYDWGFWCDRCHKEVPALIRPKKRKSKDLDERIDAPEENTCFYHCHCGYDLCKACGASIIKASQTIKENYSTDLRNLATCFSTPSPLRKKLFTKTETIVGNLRSATISSSESESPVVELLEPKLDHGRGRDQAAHHASDANTKNILDSLFEEDQSASPHLPHRKAHSKSRSKVQKNAIEKTTHADLTLPGALSEQSYRNDDIKRSPLWVPPEIRENSGWVWHYEVLQADDTIYILYMSCADVFGCLVMNTQVDFHSAVLYDAHRKMVFYIPRLDQSEPSATAKDLHHYVRTVYKDPIIMLREADVLHMARRQNSGDQRSTSLGTPGTSKKLAQNHETFLELPRYFSVLQEYSKRLARMTLPFRRPKTQSVSYLRSFSFDCAAQEDPEWYLFRLSNGHVMLSIVRDDSQIRWLAPPLNGKQKGKSGVSGTPKYILKNDEFRLYNNREYLQTVRKALQSMEKLEHDDI